VAGARRADHRAGGWRRAGHVRDDRRWIFLVNVPLGIIALLCTLRMVPNTTEARKRALDWTGFLLLGAGLALFLYGVELINGSAVQCRGCRRTSTANTRTSEPASSVFCAW
jgi:hypothetical protein